MDIEIFPKEKLEWAVKMESTAIRQMREEVKLRR